MRIAEDEQAHLREDDAGLMLGTLVILDLVEPLIGSQRIVCVDSCFASVKTCEELLKRKLRFIGVVKTATKGFSMAYLSRVGLCRVELFEKGDRKGVVRLDANGDIERVGFVWPDQPEPSMLHSQ